MVHVEWPHETEAFRVSKLISKKKWRRKRRA